LNKKVASSPKRHTFQVEGYIKRQEEQGLEPLEEYIAMFKTWKEQDKENLVDPAWQKNNMEHDLRSSKELCDKVKASENYAQNLYAALCNQDWQRNEVWPLLKGETYSCSWRYAGGIVADMREEGDYIEWYCSGIQGEPDESWVDLGHVPEGTVTDQIREDLFRLGWLPVNKNE
jgi:hypothetical protein